MNHGTSNAQFRALKCLSTEEGAVLRKRFSVKLSLVLTHIFKHLSEIITSLVQHGFMMNCNYNVTSPA